MPDDLPSQVDGLQRRLDALGLAAAQAETSDCPAHILDAIGARARFAQARAWFAITAIAAGILLLCTFIALQFSRPAMPAPPRMVRQDPSIPPAPFPRHDSSTLGALTLLNRNVAPDQIQLPTTQETGSTSLFSQEIRIRDGWRARRAMIASAVGHDLVSLLRHIRLSDPSIAQSKPDHLAFFPAHTPQD